MSILGFIMVDIQDTARPAKFPNTRDSMDVLHNPLSVEQE